MYIFIMLVKKSSALQSSQHILFISPNISSRLFDENHVTFFAF